MNNLAKFIKKETLHIIRDYRTLMVLFGLPVIQVVIFGFAIRTEVNDANIGIYDKSKDNITKELTSKILSSGYFKLNAYIESPKDIEKAFKSGKVNQVIVFEENFSENLFREGNADIQLLNDASNPNLASILNAYSTSIIRDFQNEIRKSHSKSISIIPEFRMMYNPELKSVFMFVPGLIAFIMLLICALMTSIAIAKEKELGTMEILLVSPLKPIVIILGKVIPYIFIAFLDAVAVLIIALTVFELPFQGSIPLFLGIVTLYIITSLSLGILISIIAKTQQVAMMISLAALLMPTMLLSGFIFPVENMPEFLQWVSHLIPAKWVLIIFKDIMLKGLGIEYFWKELLVLIVMTVFFIGMSMKKFKLRLE